MKVVPDYSETSERAMPSKGATRLVYQKLLYTVLQKLREQQGSGVVIALSSSNPGEGVTHVARALLRELSSYDLTSVAGINVNFLRKLHEPTVEAIRNSAARSANYSTEGHTGDTESGRSFVVPEHRSLWESSWQYRRDCIEMLRSEFDYTIIDCPSLEESGDLFGVAPFVDGVILVVEANRTRRDQPRQAEQSIGAAGGTVLGCILNKQTNEVPQWLSPNT
jgi:Mrp family chromosome partitioning ATPase